MKFRDEKDKRFLYMLMGGDVSVPVEDLSETYLDSKNDYLNRMREWKRAQIQKQNWRRHRFNYRRGIERFHRNMKSPSIVDNVIFELKKNRKFLSLGEGQVRFNLREYDKQDFVRSLVLLKGLVLLESSHFQIEDEYVDFMVFTEEFCESVSKIEKAAMCGEETSGGDFELVLAVLKIEDLSESRVKEQQSLVEVYFLE